MLNLKTNWDADNGILITHLQGNISPENASDWEAELLQTEALLPAGSSFRMLVNLHGYEPENLEAHQSMRNVVPQLLLRNGFLPGYSRLYPEQKFEPKAERGIHCMAVAHIHHDPVKMSSYQEKYGSEREAFFTDEAAATDWLQKIASNF